MQEMLLRCHFFCQGEERKAPAGPIHKSLPAEVLGAVRWCFLMSTLVAFKANKLEEPRFPSFCCARLQHIDSY